MVTKSCQQGLIVSAGRLVSAGLDELVACCGWPVLLQANARRLCRELSLLCPTLSLFWLDDERDVARTVQLLTRVRAFQPAVWRVALAYRLADETELAVRLAGIHLYLPAIDGLQALVQGPLSDLVGSGNHRVSEASGEHHGLTSQAVLDCPRNRLRSRAGPRGFAIHAPLHTEKTRTMFGDRFALKKHTTDSNTRDQLTDFQIKETAHVSIQPHCDDRFAPFHRITRPRQHPRRAHGWRANVRDERVRFAGRYCCCRRQLDCPPRRCWTSITADLSHSTLSR